MKGLGMDLCEVERIRNAMKKTASFEARYYTQRERDYIAKKGASGAASAAAMFAAKEAFLKAVGVGLGAGIALNEIGVIHNERGAPAYELSGAAKEKLNELGATNAYLSLTHEGGMAGAVCVLE